MFGNAKIFSKKGEFVEQSINKYINSNSDRITHLSITTPTALGGGINSMPNNPISLSTRHSERLAKNLISTIISFFTPHRPSNQPPKKHSLAFSIIELTIAFVTISCLVASFAPVVTKKISALDMAIGGSGSVAGTVTTDCKDKPFGQDGYCRLCYKDKCIMCNRPCGQYQYLDIPTCLCVECTNEEKAYGPNHYRTAVANRNIGNVYCDIGELDSALFHFEKSVSVVESIYGPNNSKTGVFYNDLAFIYFAKEDFDNTLLYFNKALTTIVTSFGEEHPDAATAIHNIGYVYYTMHDYDKAMEYLDKALAIRLKVYDSDHPNIASSYNVIGNVYYELGDFSNALKHYEQAFAIRKAKLPEGHPDTMKTQQKITEIQAKLKEQENEPNE